MKNMAEKIPNCPVMIERPKMPKATWEALKVHIFREQVKKKQALEQTQEVSGQRSQHLKSLKCIYTCLLDCSLKDRDANGSRGRRNRP